MKNITNTLFIIFVIAVSFVFSAEEILHEVNGSVVTEKMRTKGPQVLIRSISTKSTNLTTWKNDSNTNVYHILLRDSIQWLELEKNTNYSICIEDTNGVWKGTDFSYKTEEKCILLNSGNYVKNGRIWYITQIGNTHTFNLLVGMKFVDLSTKKHLLGSETIADASYSKKGEIYYRDPIRSEHINEVLAVDKYKVTECEFIQALWDSIPAQTNKNVSENNNFWIEKKKTMQKGGLCDAHDSAAIRVNFYHALIYANIRSIRDGFKPVYSLTKTNDSWRSFKEDGSFNVENTSFFETSSMRNYIHVEINKDADGYRLPYYDEWMALAGAPRGHYDDKSLKDDSSRTAQYAWFGVIENDEFYAKFDKNKYSDQLILNHSCGKWMQKSRPVGKLKANGFGLYDIFGLVCEKTLLPGKSIFNGEVSLCKGGFLTSSLKEINTETRCGDDGFANKPFQGLRLVRQIK